MAALTFRSDWASESASTADLDGAGIIGGLIGTTDMQLLTTEGITPGATHFTTAAISTEEGREAELTAAAVDSTPAPTPGTGLPTGMSVRAAESATVLAQQPDLPTETHGLLEDTRNPAVKVGRARAPSAATTVADRQRAIRHAEAPALAAEQRVAAAHRAAAEDRAAAVVADIRNGTLLSRW